MIKRTQTYTIQSTSGVGSLANKILTIEVDAEYKKILIEGEVFNINIIDDLIQAIHEIKDLISAQKD